ncbi:hypothetical protein BRD00_11450 [Halobacteriales archaeon QS_8_69_26]|nr:MAG: hypothetical protein BRD00_11450 [Halobacteriales archaeon QS_8_69_26]
MPDEPVSLLTNDQRRRLSGGDADAEAAEEGQDRQAIRERVTAGLGDFEHLVDYPDEEFELALEAVDDEELTRTLAEMRVVEERIRLLRGIEGDAVVASARNAVAAVDADGAATLGRVEFHTTAEQRELAEREAGTSPWLERAEALLQFGLLFLVVSFVVAFLAPDASSGPVGSAPFLIGSLAVAAGLVIVGLRGVKHDLVPAVRGFL